MLAVPFDIRVYVDVSRGRPRKNSRGTGSRLRAVGRTPLRIGQFTSRGGVREVCGVPAMG